MTHRSDKSVYGKRRAARVKVAQDHGSNASVKDRLDNLETATGMVPAA